MEIVALVDARRPSLGIGGWRRIERENVGVSPEALTCLAVGPVGMERGDVGVLVEGADVPCRSAGWVERGRRGRDVGMSPDAR